MRIFYSTLRPRLHFQHAAPFGLRFQYAPCDPFQHFRSLFWPRSGGIRLCQGQDAFFELLQLGHFVVYGPEHDTVGSGGLAGV
jgi:hypothetical protein